MPFLIVTESEHITINELMEFNSDWKDLDPAASPACVSFALRLDPRLVKV